jgi:hypothetical protein
MTVRSRDRIPLGVRFSVPVQTGPGTHPASYSIRTRSVSQRQSSRGVRLTTHPHLALRLKKDQSYISTPHLGLHGLF